MRDVVNTVAHTGAQARVGGAPPHLTAAPHLPLGVEPKNQRAGSTALVPRMRVSGSIADGARGSKTGGTRRRRCRARRLPRRCGRS
eukprot:5259507-Prymnesium_polylepis.1